MDIQALRDQAKEARRQAELQFLTMSATGDLLVKQQELQKDLLPTKPLYTLTDKGRGRSPEDRGLEMRRLQAEQMEQRVKDMKKRLQTRSWYDGAGLHSEDGANEEEEQKGDPLEEVFKFAQHAPKPDPAPPAPLQQPKESLLLSKQESAAAAAAAAAEKPILSRPVFPNLSETLSIPTTSEPKAEELFGDDIKMSSVPPSSFRKNMEDYDAWLERPGPPPYGYPEMYPPPPPPVFQSSHKLKPEEMMVVENNNHHAGGKTKHKSRRSKHRGEGRKHRSRKDSHEATNKNKEDADNSNKRGESNVEKSGKEAASHEEESEERLKNVSEHSKRVASVHELEKERIALRQDIALLAAAVQNRNQMPPPPPAPVIVQYPMPQAEPQQSSHQAQAQAPPSKDLREGLSSKKGDSTDDIMRMFNSAFSSGDLALKKYLQHEVLRLRKRNDFLETERVDLLTNRAETKRMVEDFVTAKASLESLQAENIKFREENGRLQGLNDILTEDVKRGGGDGGSEDTSSLDAELASLRLMNQKLKEANKGLLEEQRNYNNVENQLLGKIESLESTKTMSPVRKLENQIMSLENENLEKEEQLSVLQERAAQIDLLREENANLELQLIELKMKTVQEIPLNAKIEDASKQMQELQMDNARLIEQVKSLAALKDELTSSKRVLETKCAMYEKAMQEGKTLSSGITMYDPTGQLVEKNKKELASAVKDYVATEYGASFKSDDGAVPSEGTEEAEIRSPRPSPHGKLIIQTGKENIQSYLIKASTRKDFMRMQKNQAVKALLAAKGDFEIEFSDLVFKREETGTLKKFILVITKRSLYLLNCDQYKSEWGCNFSDLFSIVWDSQIVEDLTFKVATDVDICIQSPRRDIVIGTILTLLEESQSNFQVKKDLSTFNLHRAIE